MNLDNIYAISNAINEQIIQGKIKKEQLEDMYIHIQVNPDILYGIDKEFYRLSHDDSTEGFEHKSEIKVKIKDQINKLSNLYKELEELEIDINVE